MIVVDFIDMATREDKLKLLEYFELALEKDKAKPQIGQLSDLGLVELTRHRQGQSISEIFTKKCDKCQGQGFIIEDLKFMSSLQTGEQRAKINKIKGPFNQNNNNNNNNQKNNNFQKFNKNKNDKKEFNKNNNFKQDNKKQEQGELAPEVQEVMNLIMQENTENIENNNNIEPLKPEINAEIETKTPEIQDTKEENKKPQRVSRKAKKAGKKEQKTNELKEQNTEEKVQTDSVEQKEEKPKKRTRKPSARKAAKADE